MLLLLSSPLPTMTSSSLLAWFIAALAADLAYSQQCTAGQQVLPSTGASPGACAPCIGNTYCLTPTGCPGGCVQCPNGTGASPNHTTCLSGQCVICPQGSYCQGGTTMQGCPAGTYGSAPGLSLPKQCTPCAAGTFSFANNRTACSGCAQGSYSLAASTACALCQPGTYASQIAAPICTPCKQVPLYVVP